MAKNAKSSWVGTTARPQYQTYQTAGLLRPSPQPPVTPTTGTTPTTPTPPPAVPPPVTPPVGYPPIPVGPPAYPQPVSPEPGELTPREQLVNAVIRNGGGAPAGGGKGRAGV